MKHFYLKRLWSEWEDSCTYIHGHLAGKTIIHNQAVSQPNAMRLHRVLGIVGEVANVHIVEVIDILLCAASSPERQVQRSKRRHGVGKIVIATLDFCRETCGELRVDCGDGI